LKQSTRSNLKLFVVSPAQASAVATGYASALSEACGDKAALESVHADMETITAYMAANPAVGAFLKNPTMEGKVVKDVLSKLGDEADFHPFTRNFLNLLVDKKRINSILSIAEEFENLYCESTDTQVRHHPTLAPPAALAPCTSSNFFRCLAKKSGRGVGNLSSGERDGRSEPHGVRCYRASVKGSDRARATLAPHPVLGWMADPFFGERG
jgi:hypothetical protein